MPQVVSYESDPPVLRMKPQIECCLLRLFVLSACISIIEEKKNYFGVIVCRFSKGALPIVSPGRHLGRL